MKWLITLLILIVLGVGGYLLAAYVTGGALPTFGLIIGGDRGEVRRVALKFWEDLKFDDPKSAAKLMLPEDMTLVRSFTSKTFHIAPELLDVTGFEIVSVEIDSTGQRARVKSRILANDLGQNKLVKTEAMLFLRKIKTQWFLDLSSSF